ncbi:MAG: protein kinase [Polyangiaceae bacterium]|nr:protein kinase [Polyangiaceae bacterium]
MFPQIFGKYVLEREIASGGMAHVYLATLRGAVGFQKRLVVKQIRPELASDPGFVARFVEEAKTTVGLNHPNIVPVYELGVEQGVYYIALEFCEGITLGDLLTATGPLDAEEGAYLGVETCRALDYAHRRAKVVHRDVTPRNVLIDEEGAVRLIDFGIAAPVRSDGETVEAFGSPGHMPPEQLKGEVVPATDVFAVAALLLEAWSGRPPFRRATAKASHEAVMKERPAAPSRYDERLTELDTVIGLAVDPDARKRPADAEELAKPLRDFLRRSDRREVERRLGRRVRLARREAAGSVASIPDLERPQGDGRVPTLPDGSTQTFAANQEIEIWTRRVDGVAPEDGDVDQLLDGATPQPTPVTPVARPSTPGPEAETGPATRRIESEGTPKMPAAALKGGDELAHADSEDKHEPSGELDSALQRDASETKSSPSFVWLLAALVGVGALLFVLSRVFAGDEQSGQVPASRDVPSASLQSSGVAAGNQSAAPQPSGQPSLSAEPTASASAPRGSSSAPENSAPTSARVAGSAPPPQIPEPSGTQSVAAPVKSAPSEVQDATLNLTSMPPSQVSVGGRARGTTPIMGLKLAPGAYLVVFTNPTLGERVPAQIQLKAGQSKRVHVDFTGATPRVIQ